MSIALNDFRTMMGKYNLGNLIIKTDASGQTSLTKVNNARVFKSARATATDTAKNEAVRQALLDSIASYLSGRGISAVTGEYLEQLRGKLLGEGNGGRDLTRNEIATVLDELDHRVATRDFTGAYESGVASQELKNRAIVQIRTSHGDTTKTREHIEKAYNDILDKIGKFLKPENGAKIDPALIKLAATRAGISEQRVRTYLATRLSTIIDKATLHLPNVRFAQPDENRVEKLKPVDYDKIAKKCIAEVVRDLHLETVQLGEIAKLKGEERKAAEALRGDASIPVKELMPIKGENALKSLLNSLAELAGGKIGTVQVKFGGARVTFKTEGQRLSATVGKATFTVPGADELLERIMGAIDAAKPGDIQRKSVGDLLQGETKLFSSGNADKDAVRRAQVSKWFIMSFAGLSEIQLQGLSRDKLIEVAKQIIDDQLANRNPTPENVQKKVAELSNKCMYSPEMCDTIAKYGAPDKKVVFDKDYNRGVQNADAFDALAADLFSCEEAWLHDEDPYGRGLRIKNVVKSNLRGVMELLDKEGDEKIKSLSNRMGVDLSAPMTMLKDALKNIQRDSQGNISEEAIENLNPDALKTIEETIDKLLDDAMEKLQGSFAKLVGEGLVKGKQVEDWKMTFDELVRDMKKSGDTNEGKFFHKVMSTYLTKASAPEKRSMLASLLRQSPKDADAAAQFGALLKGAGPVFQKLLQGISESEIPPALKGVFADMKSNLAPIPKKAVNAMLRKLIADSKGTIASVTVKKTLGSASVGQAFLCEIKMADGSSKPCVVKMLKPDVQNRFAREVPILQQMARDVDEKENGLMSGQLNARLDTIKDELNFKAESEHLSAGTEAYGKVPEGRKSVASNRKLDGVSPDVNILVLELVEGDPVDKFLSQTIENRIGNVLEGTKQADGLYKSPTIEECIGKRRELAKIHDDLAKCQEQLLKLAEHWFDTSVFQSGFFHGDLHAGNIMISPDLEKITMIDFGNAMKIDNADRDGLTKLVCYAGSQEIGRFLDAFGALLPPQQKDAFKAARNDLVTELNDVFRKGTLNDTGSRLYVAINKLERKGFSSPKSIYNFIQSQTRLQNAIEEVGLKMRRVKALYDQQAPEKVYSFEMQDIPEKCRDQAVRMFGPFYALNGMASGGSGGTFEFDFMKFALGASEDPNNEPEDRKNWKSSVNKFLECFTNKPGQLGLDNLKQVIDKYVIPMNRSLESLSVNEDGNPVSLKSKIDDLKDEWEAAFSEATDLEAVKDAAQKLLKGLQDVQDLAAKVFMHQAKEPRAYGEAVYDVIAGAVKKNGAISFLKTVGIVTGTKLNASSDRQKEIVEEMNKVDGMRRVGRGNLKRGFIPSSIQNSEHWNTYKALAQKISFSSGVEKLLVSSKGQVPGSWASNEEDRKAFAADWLFNVQMIYANSLKTQNNPYCTFYTNVLNGLIFDKTMNIKASIESGMIRQGDELIHCDDFVRDFVGQHQDDFNKHVDSDKAVMYPDEFNGGNLERFFNLSRLDGTTIADTYKSSIALMEHVFRPEIFANMPKKGSAGLSDIRTAGFEMIKDLELTDEQVLEMANELYRSQDGSAELKHNLEFYQNAIRTSYKKDLKIIFALTLDYIAQPNSDEEPQA